jgi:hypothetical protein
MEWNNWKKCCVVQEKANAHNLNKHMNPELA